MQYRIEVDKDVFDLNPELRAIPEFAKLTDRQMKLVILFADIKTPLRSLQLKDRREQAWKVLKGPMEGNRPDKNGRAWINAQVESVEVAIGRYKELQYDEDLDTLDAINASIAEIKEFLRSDKSILRTDSKGKPILDKNGKEQFDKDPKVLKIAVELGEKLPNLVESRKKLQELLKIQENKFETETQTIADLPKEMIQNEEEMSVIDMLHMAKQEKNED